MHQNLAHRGVVTAVSNTLADRSFQIFCERQRSRVAAIAQTAHRRYITRVVKLQSEDTPDVIVKGYGIGGAPSRAHGNDD